MISSPTVLTSSRRGDAVAAFGAPIGLTRRIRNALDLRRVSRSNQSLPMMPLTDGVAPVSIVAWPIAVTVG